ncbi:MAG: acetate--CoA ligase family protein, partial [Candidatus Binatia bacterium]
VHKTDVGGVVLGVTSPEQACRRAADLLARVRAKRPDARLDGILVQPMAADATRREMLLGMVRDPQFGPLVMLGFGGVWVELLRDTAVRLAPLGRADACAMLDELRLAPALGAVRGLPPIDREALVAAVCCFARLAADLPELAELEINPLLAGPDGVLAVDVRGTVIPPEGS